MTTPSPIRRSTRRVVFLVLAMLAAAGARSAGRDITLPVRPDTAFLQQAVIAQLFTDRDETARVWDDGSGCNFLVLSDPRLETGNGLVRMISHAETRIGTRVGSRCIVVTDWSGTIETAQTVELEPGGSALRFNVVDSKVHDENVAAGVPIGMIWGRVKDYVHPRLDAIRIDLAPALEDLRAVLRLMLRGDGDSPVHESLDSIAPESVTVIDDGLLVELGMRVPESTRPPAEPTRALTPSELARFEAAWQGWESFITFLVKHFASATTAPEVRRELLDVLIEARYDLVRLLAAEPADRRADPVRALFIDTWTRLAPVLRKMSPQMPRERALNLLSFITAADALRALDELGPEFGLEISLDGLRRMARILAPEAPGDPLQYDEQVDPELRELFDFGPPLRLRRPQDPAPRSMWRGILRNAHAESPVDDDLVDRLNEWVPSAEDLEPYLESVRRLLSGTSRALTAESELEPDMHGMFRAMVLATAWQETCWRQFTRVDGRIIPIRSPAGAVGIMQVVPNVWRGFYDPQGLTRDIGYNAAAGGEILMHYLVKYAIRKGEDREPGGRENLARATYAAYNGGPGHLRRYRAADTSEQLKAIDLAFREKYDRVRSGDELAVRECYTD